jgi:hypothetical protein
MRTLGFLTTLLAASAAAYAVVVVVHAAPDIRRYLKIRSM